MKDREKKDTNTIKYWQNRAAARFENQEQQSLSYIHRIKNAYTDAEIRTIREIKKLYANYYHNDKTFDKFALQGIEPNGNIARFKAEMERLGLNQYLPENYDFRMTRLEMLNNQIWAELKKAGIEQNNLTVNSVINTINNSYNQAIFDTEKQFGSLLTFSKLDSRTVQEILNYKIEGKHFSNRIWKNTDILAEQINSKIATAVAIGQSPEKTIREVRERFDVGRFYAERLVRTESAFYHNSAELRAYQELGVEKYRIIATLDGRTSDICQHKDHKVFKIAEAKQGVNFPPFHPLCRTTTAAYFGEEFKPETRIARDSKTGKSYEIPNMNYEQWAKISGISRADPVLMPSISPADDKIEELKAESNSKKPEFIPADAIIEKKLQKLSDKIFKNLTNKELLAIDNFTDAGSSVFNRAIGNDKESEMYPEDRRDERLLHNVVSNSKMGEDVKVYSGISHSPSFAGINSKIGEIFETKMYTSASLKKSVAKEFAGFDEYGKEILLEINVPKDAKALYLGDNSHLKNDKELIINRNSSFKVLKREEKGGTIKMEVELLK